ncbi:DNA translocase FtsK [Bacillus cereus]|uniref:DNA translocase FtsK n=1 Tax=Bacillus cereus TaxID=1396 RepID=UPI0020D271BA|nr:DNA translocase FtsK [Bacillus cereus]
MLGSKTKEVVERVYEQAKQFVIEQQKVSVSFIQCRFRVRYNAGATIVRHCWAV